MFPSPLFAGLRLVPHPLAESVEVKWVLEKHPTQKRRRNWRPVRTETRTPCAFKTADGTLYVHPTIYAQLKNQFDTNKETGAMA